MNTTVTEIEPVAIRAWAERRMIYLELTDGRIVGFPADRSQILSQASEDQLKGVQVELDGGIIPLDVIQLIGAKSSWHRLS